MPLPLVFRRKLRDFIYPEFSIGVSRSVFYTNKSLDWEYTGVESFNSVTLGVVQDYSYGEEIDAYLETNKWNRELVNYSYGDNPQISMIKMLKRGRLDVIYEDQAVIEYLLKKIRLSGKTA